MPSWVHPSWVQHGPPVTINLLTNYFTWCQKLGLIFLSPQLLVHDLFIAMTPFLWSSHSFLSQLQWLPSASSLQVLDSTSSPQASGPRPVGAHAQGGAVVTPKVLGGDGLDAPILVCRNSDQVLSAHEVLAQFKTVLNGFSSASSVKGDMLPCHRVIIFHWWLCSQVCILLKPCFHSESLCPALQGDFLVLLP